MERFINPDSFLILARTKSRSNVLFKPWTIFADCLRLAAQLKTGRHLLTAAILAIVAFYIFLPELTLTNLTIVFEIEICLRLAAQLQHAREASAVATSRNREAIATLRTGLRDVEKEVAQRSTQSYSLLQQAFTRVQVSARLPKTLNPKPYTLI